MPPPTRRQFLATAAAAALGPRPAMAAPASEALLSFGLIADAQFADADPQGERHYRATPEKLRRAVDTLAGRGLPFTLHLGDFIDRDFRSFDVMLPILGGLGHPVRHLLGNHDYEVAAAEKCRVAPALGMPHDYYAFAHAGVRFVMLDTNEVSTYKHPPDCPATAAAKEQLARLGRERRPAARPYNGNLSQNQCEWLERTLAAAAAAGERVLVCGHHPLLPPDSHTVWDPEPAVAILARHRCVAAYLCGHNHAGAYAEHQGLHLVNFRSLLHRPDTTAFSIVHLHRDRLVVEAHGREVPRDLALRAG